MEIIVRSSESIKEKVILLNGSIKELLGNYSLVDLDESSIEILAGFPEVLFIEKPTKLYYESLNGKRTSCIADYRGNNNGGQGVLVGIIDSGIDYLHDEFLKDGKTRIVAIYDETMDKFFSKEEINQAIENGNSSLSRDDSGHGTHVAGIAAGNNGVAFMSDILVVKIGTDNFFNTARLMEGVDFALRFAISKNQPIAINISMGSNLGAHDGTSLLETYLDYVATIWKTSICVGTGNEGNKRVHAEILLKAEKRICELVIGRYEKEVIIQIWKKYQDDINISINGYLIEDTKVREIRRKKEKILWSYREPSPYSYNQELIVQIIGEDGFISSGVWKIDFLPKSIKSGEVNIWLEATTSETGFLTSTDSTTLTIPSTSNRVISVGAYNGKNNNFAEFSGRGYTKNLVAIKPDLVAPGVEIISASAYGGYISRSGTSMATPFVTGAAAILMSYGVVQKNNLTLYGEKLKAILIKNSKWPVNGDSLPDEKWGWGVLCVPEL